MCEREDKLRFELWEAVRDRVNFSAQMCADYVAHANRWATRFPEFERRTVDREKQRDWETAAIYARRMKLAEELKEGLFPAF